MEKGGDSVGGVGYMRYKKKKGTALTNHTLHRGCECRRCGDDGGGGGGVGWV